MTLMTRTEIEHLEAHPEKYDIDFIIGVDDNPDDAKNAMFYIRMKSFRKKSGKYDSAREIWLSCEDMKMLSGLMTYASKYWNKHTLKKNTRKTEMAIKKFKRIWEKKKSLLSLA